MHGLVSLLLLSTGLSTAADGELRAVFSRPELEAVRAAAGRCEVYRRTRLLVQQMEREEKAIITAAWPAKYRTQICEPEMPEVFDQVVLWGEPERAYCLCAYLE